jgi:hypothetical protein
MKTNLVEATQSDQDAFKKGLEELLNKLSLKLTLNIVKSAVGVKLEDGSVKNVFADGPTIILQKKVEVPDTTEPEAPKITDVKAEPTISPFVPQPPKE